MKKIILFSIIAVSAVTFSSVAKATAPPVDQFPSECGGCGGGERTCCANTNLNFG